MIRFDSGHWNPSRYIASTSVKFPIAMPPARVDGVDQIRHAAHRLDAAGEHDVRFAEQDRLRTGDDRLQPRRAGLVDRLRRRAVRNAGTMADLTPGIGTRAGLAAVADQHFVDVGRLQAGALDRRARRNRAELRRMEIAKRSAVAANRRARGPKDDDVAVGHNTPF